MKKYFSSLVLLSLLFPLFANSQFVIWANNIDGERPSLYNPFNIGDTTAPDITVSGIIRGTGLYGAGGENMFNADSWARGPTIDSADYFSFILKAKTGKKLNLAQLKLSLTTSQAGPRTVVIVSQFDTLTIKNNGISTVTLNQHKLIDSAIFKVYGYNAVGSEGQMGINDFIFYDDFPLPIELISFNFSINQNTVNLFWQTAKEENNEGFDIERKNEVDNWIKIANIKGAGNSTVPQSYNFKDKNIKTGQYFYRLKQIDYNGNFEYFELNQMVIIESPKKFELNQNYPNPFNPLTTISFSLPHDAVVRLSIFDMLGKEITTLVNQKLSAGIHQYIFDAKNISSGIYFYKIETSNFTETKKMVLLK